MLGTRELILNFIKQYRVDHDGLSPTMQEIADGVGVGKTTTHYNIQQLLLSGKLRRDGHVRGLIPTDDNGDTAVS